MTFLEHHDDVHDGQIVMDYPRSLPQLYTVDDLHAASSLGSGPGYESTFQARGQIHGLQGHVKGHFYSPAKTPDYKLSERQQPYKLKMLSEQETFELWLCPSHPTSLQFGQQLVHHHTVGPSLSLITTPLPFIW